MRPYIAWSVLPVLLLLFTTSNLLFAQTPGLIVEPKNGIGNTFLNPNGDKFTSTGATGFVSNDVAESEIPFKKIPSAEPEPTGDNNGGPTDGATDFVRGADGSGFYAFYDGTNVIFRFRVGGKSNGARGYSVLLDTDLRMGSTGFYKDPNFVAQTNSRSGNPGFELEVLYAQGKGVKILNVDGTIAGIEIASYPETTHSQISVALSKTGGDVDYFIDFGVPAAALGVGTQYIRLVGTTGTSANSALANNASDVWGINDIPHKNLVTNWTTLINMQCGIGITALSAGGTGLCICTPAPVVDGPITPGMGMAVTGVWNRLSSLYASQTSLTLYKNGAIVSTITATTGVPWSITVPSITVGDTLYATAQSAPEQMCQTSNRVVASCSGVVPPPAITCASLKGMQGTIPLGATMDIYEIIPASVNPYTNKDTTGLRYTNNGSNRTFSYYGSNPTTGDPCSYSQQQFTYNNVMLVVNQGGCLSQPYPMCLSSQNWNTPSLLPTLKLNTPITAGQSSVSGTGGGNNQLYRLFVNGTFTTSGTGQLGGSFTFTGLSLSAGDTLVVYEQVNSSSCMTYSPTATVTCALSSAPTITSNSSQVLSTATTIGGYSSLPGALVTLYKGNSPSGTAVGSSMVNNAGEWNVNGLTLTSGETYYAVQTLNGCVSAASAGISVLPPTPLCPSITGSYTESATKIDGTFSSAFTGTVRLYRDGALIGSVPLNNATTWSVPVNQDKTNFIDVLTPGDSLFVTSWTSAYGERGGCGYTIVNCDVPPAPGASPTSLTITQGQAATFTLASSSAHVVYSVVDGADLVQGTSVFGNGGAISVTTKVFGSPGTYNLKVAADNLAAPQCRQTQDVVVTVNANTLPIRFVSTTLSASSNGNRTITWSVSGEEGFSHYLVERSQDCNHFEPIATVTVRQGAAGLSLYNYTDAAPLLQKGVCYRIAAVNNGSGVLYGRVVSLSESKGVSALLVPNPAGSETTLYLTSDRQQLVTVALLDATGRAVTQKKEQVFEGRNALTFSELNNYPKGHYIVTVTTDTDTQHLKLIIK